MAASSLPRRFAAWRVEALPSFCGILLRVAHRRILNANERQHKETIQTQCNSLDTAICYFHIAIWLGRCQPVLVQFERTSEPDAVRHRVSPLSLTTCWPAGPEFLGWPLIHPGGEVQADLAPLREDSCVNIPGCALPGPPHQRWRRDAPQPLEILQPRQGMETCVHIPEGGLRCASWNTRGLLGSTASSQVSSEQKQKHLQRLTEKNDIVCLQEAHGKDFCLQALQVQHTQFRMFGTFIPKNVNAGGSAVLIRKNPCQKMWLSRMRSPAKDVTISSEYDLMKAFWKSPACTLSPT